MKHQCDTGQKRFSQKCVYWLDGKSLSCIGGQVCITKWYSQPAEGWYVSNSMAVV